MKEAQVILACTSETCARMEGVLWHILPSCGEVLLIAPPTVKRGEWVPDDHLIMASRELAKGYQDIAQKLGIHFADADKWSVDLTFDGVHFSGAGHRAFAEGICKVLLIYEKERLE